jgi:tetratricopeptide (TPR) repeat protein
MFDGGDGEVEALWTQLPRCQPSERAELLDQLGGALVHRRGHDEALAAVEAARALYIEAGAEAEVARCDHNAGVILAELGRRAEALDRYAAAEVGYRSLLRWPEAATAGRAVADLLADEGRIDEALTALEAAARLHDDAGEPVRGALARLEAGELLLDSPHGPDGTDIPGRLEAAAHLLAQARATMREDGALLWVARADQLLAEVARRRGNWEDAFLRLEAARAVFDAADMDDDRDRCDDQWCCVLIDAGRPDEAVARLERARAARQSGGDPVGVAWCDLHLSRALERLGEPAAAASHRRRARAVFDAAGLDAVLRSHELQPH